MLVFVSMDDMITCASCNKDLESQLFRKGRTICTACKQKQIEERVSRSYESYLRHLHSQSKSSVKCGKRADHVEWHIEPEDLVALWQKQEGKCAVSGVFLTHHKDGSGRKDYNASIDRISGDRGYTPQNIQLVAYRINIMKHTLSEDMFYWWIKTINDFSCD